MFLTYFDPFTFIDLCCKSVKKNIVEKKKIISDMVLKYEKDASATQLRWRQTTRTRPKLCLVLRENIKNGGIIMTYLQTISE